MEHLAAPQFLTTEQLGDPLNYLGNCRR